MELSQGIQVSVQESKPSFCFKAMLFETFIMVVNKKMSWCANTAPVHETILFLVSDWLSPFRSLTTWLEQNNQEKKKS